MSAANSSLVNQGTLWNQIKLIFSNSEIHVNSRKTSSILVPPSSSLSSSPSSSLSLSPSPSPSSSPSSYLELDIWLPQYQLGLEFQDSYHYVSTWFNQLPLETIQHTDNIKRTLAQHKQLDLITVPCWWDGSSSSLIGTIHFHRPDILIDYHSECEPISLNPPVDFFNNPEIPDVGELMLASFPQSLSSISFPTKWWLGEKYDGIRCCWNPKQYKIYSRKARELRLGDSILTQLPINQFIDGELWFGRGQFASSYALIQGSVDIVPWHFLKLVAFDNPERENHNDPFETRYASLLASIKKDHPFIRVASRLRLVQPKTINSSNNTIKYNTNEVKTGEEKIKGILAAMIKQEGEGIVLRLSRSPYIPGRSMNLFKLKSTQGDQEGIVTDISTDLSVQLKLVDGNTIKISARDVLVPNIKVGDVVTFSHESHSRRALPLDPKIIRIRSDISWEDVVLNDVQDQNGGNYSAQPLRHWNESNMKSFLESFARGRGLDPLIPDTWYKISSNEIRQSKGGGVILDKIKGGYFRILKQLFPNIGLDENLFNIRSRWQSVTNRRLFFEKYAKENGFDPQVPENWYLQHREKIMEAKGARSVIFHHNNSLPKALYDLFPNIGFDQGQLRSSKSTWSLEQNRRKLFEKYAKASGFDPLIPENWYSQSRAHILSFKGVRRVLLYHGYSLYKALVDLFPDVHFEKEKLKGYKPSWQNASFRRKFLEAIIKKNGLDPLVPENWYSLKSDAFLRIKGVRSIMRYHNNSLHQTLCDLFPDVAIKKDKLQFIKSQWNSKYNRRKFFDDVALELGFDPLNPDNWYNVPKKSLLGVKGAQRVLQYHNNDLKTALVELYKEVNFDQLQFERNNLKYKENRKRVFEAFAAQHNFDPNDADKWLLYVNGRKILSFKGVLGVIGYYNNNLRNAIEDIFPGVQFIKKH